MKSSPESPRATFVALYFSSLNHNSISDTSHHTDPPTASHSVLTKTAFSIGHSTMSTLNLTPREEELLCAVVEVMKTEVRAATCALNVHL